MPPQHGNLQAGYPQANNGQPHSTYEAQWQQFQTSAAGQVGMQFANQALKQGHDMVQSSVGRWLSFATLKYYFNVSNGYVLSKCGLLLFPFRHKTWTRVPRAADQQGHMQQWLPPRDDINAPDLYIPTMALITYVLISAVLIGSTTAHTSGFSPDIIGKLTSTGVGVVLTEALIVRFGCYLLGVQLDIPLLDLVSYAGYKFIGVIVAEIVRFFASFTLTYVVFGYTMLALGFFSLRTMRHIILPETTQTMVHQGRKRRINFMLGIAGLQIVLAWILMA
ncbi:hypothetical protein CXG81DRAFT_8605 [Caulochytrium protostelioides]|uniref:Protein YIF1 n=1 Tax=Caulochytrium protostelioides TaxID=1555241 RepID=A0A4P9XEZ6_9FUNG|nr:hypothetical protein CXG81DRAFT_8605 [Caulochytrium protostelioides]|eukprot:RKP04132.1 hypothetical protein CXG81DRAFT_8605 [Caulochytrium protostelioides]